MVDLRVTERLIEALRKKLLNRFSGHGLPNVFRTRNKFKRVFWAFIWLICFIITLTFVNGNVSDYFSYDVEIKSRIISEYPMIFPKVTFCNKDPFTTNSSIRFLANIIRKHTLNETKLLSSFKSDEDLVNYFVENEKEHNFRVSSLFFANLTDVNTKKSLGYSVDQFIHSCQFSVWKCDLEEDFEWTYNYKLGNCFTFNPTSDKEKMINVYQSGKMNGLQLEIFTGKSDEFDSFANSNGATIYIYNHTTVYSDSDSVDVSVGQETDINLSKTIISKLKKPYSECEVDHELSTNTKYSEFYYIFNKTNHTYRQDDCMTLCYQMTLVKKCNCFDFNVNFINLFELPPLKACGKHESECIEKIFRQDGVNYYDTCRKMCPKECLSVDYKFEVSFSEYPSNTKLKRIIKKNQFLNKNNDLKKMMLKVNIFFNKLSYQLVKESPSLNISTLFSNVGGTLGLFLGWSVLSIVEILELFLQILAVTFNILKDFIIGHIKDSKSLNEKKKTKIPTRGGTEISFY